MDDPASKPTSTSRAGRLQQLDSLRGLAAVSVLIFHFCNGYQSLLGDPSNSIPVLNNAALGVDLFFVISGFVILKSAGSATSVQAFAVHRFARLWPTLFAAATLTFALVALTSFNLEGRGWREYVMSLMVAPGFFGVPAIDPSYWTLACELFFYALIGALILVLRLRRLELFCIAWLLVSLVQITGYYVPFKIQLSLNLSFCQMFIAGMMLYRLHANPANKPALLTLAAALLIGFAKSSLTEATCLCIFSLLVFLAAKSALKPLNAPALIALGRISYPLYLIHQMFGYAVISAALEAGQPLPIAIALAMLTSVLLATLLRVLVEVPAERTIRRAYHTAAHTPRHPTPAPLAPGPRPRSPRP